MVLQCRIFWIWDIFQVLGCQAKCGLVFGMYHSLFTPTPMGWVKIYWYSSKNVSGCRRHTRSVVAYSAEIAVAVLFRCTTSHLSLIQ